MSVLRRPQKITFAEMRDSGVRGMLVYCQNYQCGHSTAISGDRWPDDVRLSVIPLLLLCRTIRKKPAPHLDSGVETDFLATKAERVCTKIMLC
jgi:hypothetical protein